MTVGHGAREAREAHNLDIARCDSAALHQLIPGVPERIGPFRVLASPDFPPGEIFLGVVRAHRDYYGIARDLDEDEVRVLYGDPLAPVPQGVIVAPPTPLPTVDGLNRWRHVVAFGREPMRGEDLDD